METYEYQPAHGVPAIDPYASLGSGCQHFLQNLPNSYLLMLMAIANRLSDLLTVHINAPPPPWPPN
jgi:hypothetical protein